MVHQIQVDRVGTHAFHELVEIGVGVGVGCYDPGGVAASKKAYGGKSDVVA